MVPTPGDLSSTGWASSGHLQMWPSIVKKIKQLKSEKVQLNIRAAILQMLQNIINEWAYKQLFLKPKRNHIHKEQDSPKINNSALST